MTWSINKIQFIIISIFCMIWNCNSLTFDSNSTLTFNIHIVKNLVHHFSIINNFCFLNKPV